MMGADYYQTIEEMHTDMGTGLPRVGVGEGTIIKKAIIDKNARIGSNARLLNEEGIPNADGEGGSSIFVMESSSFRRMPSLRTALSFDSPKSRIEVLQRARDLTRLLSGESERGYRMG